MNDKIKTPLFGDHFDALEDRAAKRRSAQIILGTGTPDEAAEAVKIGSELNLPPAAVQGAPEMFRSKAEQKRAAAALNGAPRLQQWLGDPINGSIAKDDLDNLSMFEKMARGWMEMGDVAADTQGGRGFQTGVLGVKQASEGVGAIPYQNFARANQSLLGVYDRAAALNPDMTVDEMAEVMGINPMSVEASFAHGFLTADPEGRAQMVQAAADQFLSNKEAVNDAIEAIKGFSAEMEKVQGRTPNFTDIDDINAFADWLSFTTGQAVPYMAITAAMAAIGGAPGAFGAGYALGVGDINSTLLEQGVDNPGAAMIGAIPYAGLELLGPAARPARSAAVDAAQSYLQRLAKEVPAESAGEFINEAGQEIIKDVTVAAAGGEAVVLNDETLWRWFNSGMAGLGSGVVVSSGSTTLSAAQRAVNQNLERLANTGRAAQRIADLDNMAASSKLKARDQGKFLDAMAASGNGEIDLHIPATGLSEYFQSKGLTIDDEMLEAWGIEPADFAEKQLSNGTVAVSQAHYAAVISGTEDAAWFAENATLSPDELSLAEGNAEIRESLQRDYERAEQEAAYDLEDRESSVQIFDRMFSELRAAGQSPDVAQQNALLWASFWGSQADRTGKDALDLAESMGVSVRGPQSAEPGRRRGAIDIMLNTLRGRGEKALAPRGAGVLDFIKSQGGIRDAGGDVAALDAPAGVVAETREEVLDRQSQPALGGAVDFNGRGRGLDEIGRALIENGYFPEYMGGADVQADGQVVDEAAIALEAISEAIAGRDRYPEGQGPDQELVDLWGQLQERGLDLSLSNDELVAGLEDPADGQQYDQDGRLITDTPEFRAWFGDSKVVDAAGNPVVVYHGSPDVRGILSDGFAPSPTRGNAYFASDVAAVANTYADDMRALDYQNAEPHVIPLYMSLQNPMEIDAKGRNWSDTERHIDEARAAGHDGIIIRNSRDEYNNIGNGGRVSTVYVAFEPAQMKSAMTGNLRSRIDGIDLGGGPNSGSFDPNDPRILFQSAPEGDAFREWAGTDEILDADDVNEVDFSGPGPWVMRVHHGTTHDFSEFNSGIKGNKEGHFGAVNYFTTSENDAWQNYTQGGPDLTARIENMAERLDWEIEQALEDTGGDPDDMAIWVNSQYELDIQPDDLPFVDGDQDQGINQYELAQVIANRVLDGGDAKVMEVFVRTEKPFVVGGDGSPFIEFVDFGDLERRAIERVAEDEGVSVEDVEAARDDFEDQIDEARWDLEAEEENELADAVSTVAARYDLDPAEILSDLSEIMSDGADHATLEKVLRSSEALTYAEDPEDGGVIGPHVVGEIIDALGFDSIILKNADQQFSTMNMDPGTAHIHVFDKHNTNIKSVENEGGFSRSDPDIYHQEKRGSIIIPKGGLRKGQTVINLFESADLSTFLHESGHFFLEAFSDLAASDAASDSMRDDLGTIREFLGVKEGAKFTVEQHETWARTFEAYLMEGKAPSLALASAFSRFKAWLTRIYKSVRGLNVKMTPEIREVMDRMLATDAEIAAMREDMGMRPLFTDAKVAGMSDADFATYQRMARRGAEQAEAALMKRTMAKVKRETEDWFKAERKAVMAEVTTSAARNPAYQLVSALGSGRWLVAPGDDAPAMEVPDMRMDRAQLVEIFGEGILKEIDRTKLGGSRAIYTKGGEDPRIVADFFGFEGVTEMIEALQNAGKMKDFIRAETDRILTERHGDPLNDGSIEEAAAVAVHSEQQRATVAAEIRALAKRTGRPAGNIKAKVYRLRARAMFGRMSVREASRPAQFRQAERRAARNAEKAFAKVARGGRGVEAALAEAMQAKEQQILNSFLYDEARDFEARLQKGREKMRSYDKKSVREKIGGASIDPATGEIRDGYIEQIDAIRDGYDFRVRSNRQIQRAESLRAYVDRMELEGRAGELDIDPRLLDESHRKHYSRLSVDEILGLFDTVENIAHMGRRKQTLIGRSRQRDLNQVASRMAQLVRERFGDDRADRQSGIVRNFTNLLFRVDAIASDIDKAEMGDFYDAFKRDLDEGAALEQKMNVEAAEEIKNLFSVYSAKERSEMSKERVIPGGNGQPWTRQQVITLALNTGNADNLQRVLDPRVHKSVRLTRAQLDATLATLDKRDWDFVQSVWDFVDSFWPEMEKVEVRRKGRRPKKVEAQAVETPHGIYRGGYYPISFDPSKSAAARKDAESAFDQFLASGRGASPSVSDGMTKERQKTGGGRALNYDFSVMMRHVRDSTRVIAMSEAVDNSARLIRHPAVVDAFQDGGVRNLLSTLDLFLQDVGSGPLYNDDPINNLSRVIKNNFTMSRLAFNFKTVALQVTGIGQSAAVIGKMNMLHGFNDYRKRPLEVKREIMEKSAYMAERETSFQKDIYDQVNDIRLSSPVASKYRVGKNKLSAAGFWAMTKVQFHAVDIPTWLGAYRAEYARTKDEKRSIHYADRMVDRAQGGALMTDRNALERGTVSRNMRQSDFIRLWTTLGGYMVTKMNRGYVTARLGSKAVSDAETAAGKAVAAASMATDLALLYVLEAGMMALAYSLLTDDEDDEDVINFLVKEVIGSAFGGIPFVKDMVGSFNGYGAGGVLSSALEMPANLFTQAAQGELDRAFWKSLADAVGFGTGLPTTQTMRTIEEVLNGDNRSISEGLFGRNPLANN